ncbi:hypothetical protein FRC03_009173 [Tulasnella sp. 419]|nr:hypothetical protein FRC03_009173 [Tulasnella sp. 419]
MSSRHNSSGEHNHPPTPIHDIYYDDEDQECFDSSDSVNEDAIFWKKYCQEADAHDSEVLKQWNADMDSMLIFAGLFSAINTAFIIESYKTLSPGIDAANEASSKLTNQLLLLILNNLDNSTIGRADLNYASTPCSSRDLLVNQFFFSSLLSSLVSAFGAVLGKQWLNYLSRASEGATDEARGRERQMRWTGLKKYYFQGFMEFLPACLHLSLFLFLVGLIVWLEPLSPALARLVLGFFCGVLCVYSGTVILATIFPDCPYQTPLSPLCRRTISLVGRSKRNLSVVWKGAMGSVADSTQEVVDTLPWYMRFLVPIVLLAMAVLRALQALTARMTFQSTGKDTTQSSRSTRTNTQPLSPPKSHPLDIQALGWILQAKANDEIFSIATARLLRKWEATAETWTIIKEGAVLPRLAVSPKANSSEVQELLHSALNHLSHKELHSQVIKNDSYKFLQIMVNVLHHLWTRKHFAAGTLAIRAIATHMEAMRSQSRGETNFSWSRSDFNLILEFMRDPEISARDLTAVLTIIREAKWKKKLRDIQNSLADLPLLVIRVLGRTTRGDAGARALLLCLVDWLHDSDSSLHKQLRESCSEIGFTLSIMRHMTTPSTAQNTDFEWYLSIIEKLCRKDVVSIWVFHLAKDGHFEPSAFSAISSCKFIVKWRKEISAGRN